MVIHVDVLELSQKVHHVFQEPLLEKMDPP
jgi:hypothetical protein